MVRSTNTGLTAVLDPQGHIAALAPRDTKQVLTVKVQGYQGLTPYMQLGSTWPMAIVFTVLLLLLYGYSRRKPTQQ